MPLHPWYTSSTLPIYCTSVPLHPPIHSPSSIASIAPPHLVRSTRSPSFTHRGVGGGLNFFTATALAGDETVPDTKFLGIPSSLWPRFFCIGVALFCSSGAFILFAYRKFRLHKSMTKAMRGDVAAYEAAWCVVTADVAQAADLSAVEEMLAVLPPSQPIVREKTDMHAGKPAEQLAIMLMQAWAVNGTFQRAVATWKRGRGRGGGESKAGGDRDEDEDLEAVAGNGGMLPKRRQRAIEKVWRSYGGNAMRLGDLVRASLTFDTVGELKACLALILADSTIRVLRVKNRFAGKYDARKLSCGYRDIQLSVALSESCLSPEEVEKGLHEHVCEVQLHLSPIYALKNDEGHKRYVEFRNRRAE